MALPPGTRVGPYEIADPIGAGGMGEVYRAIDVNLDRPVAIKVLPAALAQDPEHLARFAREARTLASLNHPNIAIVHGFERFDSPGPSGSGHALVMELVDGPTLMDRINDGAIPVDDALPIARQIAGALEAAHEQGIIHRDLKPANIKLRPDGTVKVLDFGLAKAVQPATMPDDVTRSPSITTPAMSHIGVILGTAAYMSPEQAKGRAADRRSDLWAFGCVLFEMLTGRRAFAGEDVSDTLAAVLRTEPHWGFLPPATPARIQMLLRRCLRKESKERLDSAAAARLEIDDALIDAPASAPASSPAPVWRRAVEAAAVLILALAAAYGGWALKPDPPPVVARFAMTLGESDAFTPGRHWLAVSPDGSRFAYSANNRLYLRALDQLEATSIAGGGDPPLASPRNPFFSPDGQWIGFWQAGQLKKVSVSGGAPVTVCGLEIPPFGASWAADNTILLSSEGTEIWRVSADGGAPERIITLSAGQRAHGPQLLPGGRTVLFTLARTSDIWDEAQVVVQTIGSTTQQRLIDGGTDGRYLPTGHLVYALGDTVLAAPFDADSLSLKGAPVPVLRGVRRQTGNNASAQFAVSARGTLVYVPAVNVSAAVRTLVWVDRNGREEPIPAAARPFSSLRLSPDGTRLALDIEGDNRDIWVWDLARRAMTRVTSERSVETQPVWTPNGRRIVFSSDRLGVGTNLFWQAADGTGTAEQLSEGRSRVAYSISPDGRRLVLRGADATSGSDLLMLDLDDRRRPSAPTRLIRTPFEETGAEISPDGRWLAYQSNSSGTFEVYVRPFPDVGSGQWLVSTAGGSEPLWGRDGRELFYRAPSGAVMRVAVTPGPTWTAGAPAQLFEAPSVFRVSGLGRTYDVSLDGRRFVMMKDSDAPVRTATPERIILVLNWFEELKRLVPTK